MKRILSIALALMVVAISFGSQDDLKVGNVNFTAKFLKQVAKGMPNQNLVFSPFGIQILLALITSATNSSGPAITEIIKVAELPSTKEKIHSQFKGIVGADKTQDAQFKYYNLNHIYLRQGSKVWDWYSKTALETYNASAVLLDFTSPTTVADEINAWVAYETDDNIKNIIAADQIGTNTNSILVNAIYLYGKWDRTAFLPADTKKEDFRITDGSAKTKKVNMMHTYKKSYKYFEDTEAQYLQISLTRDGGYSDMVFVLPRQEDGLKDLVENHLDTALNPHEFYVAEVNVGLPKFEITSDVEVKDILQKLNLIEIFTKGVKLEGYHYRGRLVNTFTEFYQKAYIEIDEVGVTAATLTKAIPGVDLSSDKKYAEFKADHPFLFYIRVDGVIVYVGQVYSP